MDQFLNVRRNNIWKSIAHAREVTQQPIYRFSDWRPDPQSPPIEAKHGYVAAQIVVLLLVLLAIIGVSIVIPGHSIFIVFLGPLIAAGMVRHFKGGRRPTVETDLSNLTDLPKPDHQFAVRIIIFNGSKQLGDDRGIVTFSGDMMHFEGRRVTFGLPNQYVDLRENPPSPRFETGSRYWVSWDASNHTGQFLIYPNTGERYEFHKRIQSWYSTEFEVHQNITLPPVNSPESAV